jgi:hypothetical protein
MTNAGLRRMIIHIETATGRKLEKDQINTYHEHLQKYDDALLLKAAKRIAETWDGFGFPPLATLIKTINEINAPKEPSPTAIACTLCKGNGFAPLADKNGVEYFYACYCEAGRPRMAQKVDSEGRYKITPIMRFLDQIPDRELHGITDDGMAVEIR